MGTSCSQHVKCFYIVGGWQWDVNPYSHSGTRAVDVNGLPIGLLIVLPIGLHIGWSIGLSTGLLIGLPIGSPIGLPVGLPSGLLIGLRIRFPIGLPIGMPIGPHRLPIGHSGATSLLSTAESLPRACRETHCGAASEDV